MPNIKFWYLYRDSANYKKYDFVILGNPKNLPLKIIEANIRAQLIYETWFYHKEWGLHDLRSEYFDCDIDPTWHEFNCVEYTNEQVNFKFVHI